MTKKINGIKVSIDDVKASNTFDMTKLVLRIIALTKALSLSETELHALTYFVVNGYSKLSREQLISSKLLKSKNAVSNLVHSFRKYGIIVKNSFGEGLNPDYAFSFENVDIVKIEMLIKK